MATDPTRRVRTQTHSSDLTRDVQQALGRLAALTPSTDVPYLTVYLDWRVDGSAPGRRPGREQFERELGEQIKTHGPRGAIFDSLTADAERIAEYLDNELDSAADGVFFVSCSDKGVFEALPLALPVPTQLYFGSTPALRNLVKLAEDFPTYGVLLADQRDATLSFITLATFRQSVSLESADYPRRQKTGGLNQQRYQTRWDERVGAFARDIAEETRRAIKETPVSLLIVAGDEIIVSALDAAFHDTVKQLIVATIRLDALAGMDEIIDATLPIAEETERAREARAVQLLEDALGSGAYGAAGPQATLLALQKGQVETLVMNDDFSARGWADYSLPAFGVGDIPGSHPLGGNPSAMEPIAIEEELIRLAAQTGARIEIVHSFVPFAEADEASIPSPGSPAPRAEPARALDAYAGVGALLRFATFGAAD